MQGSSLKRINYILSFGFAALAILYLGASFLIPLTFATFLAALMDPLPISYNGLLMFQIMVLIGCIACLIIFGVKLWNPNGIQDKLSFLFINSSLLIAIYSIVSHILTGLKGLEFNNGQIVLTNLITKKVQRVALAQVAGYKLDMLNQKILLINLKGEIITIINESYYKDLEVFFLESNIKKLDEDSTIYRSNCTSLVKGSHFAIQ